MRRSQATPTTLRDLSRVGPKTTPKKINPCITSVAARLEDVLDFDELAVPESPMRATAFIVLPALALFVWAAPACTPASEPAAPPVAETATEDHEGHQMPAMDENMASSDAGDDGAAVITPDNHTFHTYPNKIEVVNLPLSEGGVWSATGVAPGDLFTVLDSKDDKLADGTPVHAVRFQTQASGNGSVVFERRATADPKEGVLEVRTVNFMIH